MKLRVRYSVLKLPHVVRDPFWFNNQTISDLNNLLIPLQASCAAMRNSLREMQLSLAEKICILVS